MNEPAVSDLQRALTAKDRSPLRRYQEMAVGSERLLDLVAYELAVMLLLPIPGAIGYAARRSLLPRFFGRLGRGALIGRGITVRHPRKIRIGSDVILDDAVTLDAKGAADGIEIGDGVLIGRGSIVVANGGALVIGAGTNVGTHCRIATRDHLRLGRSVLVAHDAYIGATNHHFERTDVPVIGQGVDVGSGIDIEDNVWIGARATILNGVRIGRDAIVGAHSLVNRDVPPFAIVAGTPARVMRMRE